MIMNANHAKTIKKGEYTKDELIAGLAATK